MFNAQRLAPGFNSNDELLADRSAASNYLFGLPIRQYQDQLYQRPADSLSALSVSDRHNQQRTKRIYWENLAFHAADYNQKPKKT
ncbi:unnamed protein product [Rotaria socialis]|nr:unnamed protein product [Rotaria socialis]CAF3571208.1 unnamed protein product [Rotaria socialis]CAF3602569.1 unnamed protein product [Rotaria socialis]CAF3786159.1 unnamed protein product [Rotaria socialis]CAF4103519.1 unnamed protein product [Rotaria socialis]